MRYSEQNAYNNCPTKYRLINVDHLRRIDNAAQENDKIFGQAIHAGLEAHYQGKDWADIERAFTALYPKNLKESDPAKSYESGIACLRAYRAHYEEQDKMWEVIATEEKGSIEFGGESHDLHIDLIGRHKQTGEIYFWDHKTTSKSPNSMSFKKYELSAQMTRYTAWVIEKYGACAGAVINLIAVGHRKRAYMGEPAGLWQKFERQVVNRTPQQIEAWKRSDEDWMKMIDYSKKNSVWPKHLSDLCSWCEFYELCLSGDDPQIKELLYTDEPNVPLSEFKPIVEV